MLFTRRLTCMLTDESTGIGCGMCALGRTVMETQPRPTLLTDDLLIAFNGIAAARSLEAKTAGPPEDEVSLCIRWLDSFAKPQRKMNPRAFSYRLKRIVEE